MPLPKVEVAVVLVALMTETFRPVYIVEVPDDTKFAAPWMERREPGVEVPMPRKLLVLSTARKLAESRVPVVE